MAGIVRTWGQFVDDDLVVFGDEQFDGQNTGEFEAFGQSQRQLVRLLGHGFVHFGRRDGHVQDVVAMLVAHDREGHVILAVAGDEDVATSLDALRSMQIPTMTGGTVPLSMVADVYTELSPQSIVRKNQKETVTITGESESGDSNAIKAAVDDIVAKYELPDGVEVGEGDTAASQIAETTGTLMLALAVAIMLVYFILATQFNSFSLPIAIMLILPIGLLGSMILLWPTGNHVSMVALLGVIILAGTVVNSSIVLIDYTLQRRQRGEDKNTAILNACPRRVRPVLMTAMTTILGLVPMVCSSGEGSEMMKPMGVVMMTGMVISTIATLFITPVYYSLTDSVASRLSGLFKKIKLPKFNFHKKNPQQ